MLVLRRLFVWLLVLALPVQGFAAVAMLHCGADPAQQVHAHSAQMGSVLSHDHEASAHHHAGTNAHQAHGPDGVALEHESFDQAGGKVAACSACDNCCLSTVSMPILPVSLATPDAVFATSVWSQTSPPEVSRARLERPPRA